jgi:hypothetical protein
MLVSILSLLWGKVHIAPMPDEIHKGGQLGVDITASVVL